METVKIIPLKHLSATMRSRIYDAQLECGKVYTEVKNIHMNRRKSSQKWPTRIELQKATKGKFALHSQTVQMVSHVLLANVETTKNLRKNHPKMKMKYPWRDKKFFPLIWPKQAIRKQANRVILPMGKSRKSIVLNTEIPENYGSAKIVWNNGYELHISMQKQCESTLSKDKSERAAVDLGQIHQAAVVTTTGKGIVISGRGIRSVKRLRNKAFCAISKKLSKCKKKSLRSKKLIRAKMKISSRTERRCRDLQHKGTAKVIKFCKQENVKTIFIGNPNGVQNKNSGKKQNQRMSQWEFGRDIKYIQDKAKINGMESFTGSERGTSSQCPHCHAKKKVSGRRWSCRSCGFIGHRDLVGATNMHIIAFGQKTMFPLQSTYLRAGAVRLCVGVNNQNRVQTPSRSSGADTRLGIQHSMLSLVGRVSKQRLSAVRKHQPRKSSANLRSSPTLEG